MPPVPGQGTAACHLSGLHRGHVAGDVRGYAVWSRPDAALAPSGSTARAVDPQRRITALPCFLARLAFDERAEARGALASRASSDRTHGVRLLLNLLLGDPARRPRRGGRGKGGHGPAARRRGAPLRRPSRQRQGSFHSAPLSLMIAGNGPSAMEQEEKVSGRLAVARVGRSRVIRYASIAPVR